MKQKRPTERPMPMAIDHAYEPSADEAAKAALDELQQLLDEAFYADLKRHLERLAEGIKGVSGRATSISNSTERLEAAQTELLDGLQDLSAVVAEHPIKLQTFIAASEASLTGVLRSEVLELRQNLDTLEKRLVRFEQAVEERWLAAKQSSARIEESLHSLSSAGSRLDVKLDAHGDRLASELHSTSSAQQDGIAQLEKRLAAIETEMRSLPPRLEALRASDEVHADLISSVERKLHERAAAMEETLLAILTSESAANRERDAALKAQLAQSSTALTTYAESQLSFLARRVRWSAVITILGWLLPAILLLKLWRLGH